jgi:hypothetical protein
MALVRGLAAVFVVASTLAFGCGSGLSSTQATTFCDQEQMNKAFCFNATVYQSCLTCYENCGDSCVPQELCPEEYLCPGQTSSPTGKDGGS